MKLNIDKQKLQEISIAMVNEINPIFRPLFRSNNPILQSSDVEEFEDWYKQAREDEDGLLSTIANSLVENLMRKLPQQYVQLSIEEIDIDTSSIQPGMKFSPKFELKSIRPFVEIQLLVSDIRTKSARFTFEIKFDGVFHDMEIKRINPGTEVYLGQFVSNVSASIIKLPFVELNEPRIIGSKKITFDLSTHYMMV